MSEELKEYFQKLKNDRNENIFLFYQFYKYPNIYLGGSEDNTMNNYYNYGSIKTLVLCEDFFHFLYLCFDDKDFVLRLENDGLNNNLLIKIRYLIFDFIEFREHYNSDLEDEEFRQFFRGNKPIGKYATKYNNLQLSGLVKYYKRCGWLYEIKLPKSKALQVDKDLLNWLKFINDVILDVYHEKYIEVIDTENFLINSIKNEEYDALYRLVYFLDDDFLINKKYFRALVCSNNFLDLCFSELLNRDLSYNLIKKIIDVLEMSLDLQNEDTILEYENLCGVISEKRVNEYNCELADVILRKFYDKVQNSKILQLY